MSYSTNTKQQGHIAGQQSMAEWQTLLKQNVFDSNKDFQHSIEFYFDVDAETLKNDLSDLGERIATELEPAVAENDFRLNLPRFEPFNAIGERTDSIIHNPLYTKAGDIIYGTGMMAKILKPGRLLESLMFFYLTSHAGEAGHNCPVACTAGIIRVLSKLMEESKDKNGLFQRYLDKLSFPGYEHNYTGAQFVTEIQGGSDVGLNDTRAKPAGDGSWLITGEKWFCSNAHADLILMTARYDVTKNGTRGLGLFLVPSVKPDGSKNNYYIRRLKEKLGTRTMASGEIDFNDAWGILIGQEEDSFKWLMENVLHLSRLYNSFAILGAAQRAWQIAVSYAKTRQAFGNAIINYPLVQQNLANIKSDITVLLAGAMATTKLQDEFDRAVATDDESSLLLRLLANLNKYVTAKTSPENIHHCIDVLGGNGAIESFSALPRLLRDSIVFENWEGTHNTLKMQILRDIHKFRIDKLFLQHIDMIFARVELSRRHDPMITAIRDGRFRLEQALERLKTSPQAVQTLLITETVDLMSYVYGALQLYVEARHQIEQTEKSSKLECLQWFILNRLNKEPAEINEDYLVLAANIVNL